MSSIFPSVSPTPYPFPVVAPRLLLHSPPTYLAILVPMQLRHPYQRIKATEIAIRRHPITGVPLQILASGGREEAGAIDIDQGAVVGDIGDADVRLDVVRAIEVALGGVDDVIAVVPEVVFGHVARRLDQGGGVAAGLALVHLVGLHIQQQVLGDGPRGRHAQPVVLVRVRLVRVVDRERALQQVVAEAARVGQDDARHGCAVRVHHHLWEHHRRQVVEQTLVRVEWEPVQVVVSRRAAESFGQVRERVDRLCDVLADPLPVRGVECRFGRCSVVFEAVPVEVQVLSCEGQRGIHVRSDSRDGGGLLCDFGA